jgi:hypothetical protein
MHDGAPAHFSRAVRDVLNNTYRGRWIGRGGPTAWPPRSSELNPLEGILSTYYKCTLSAVTHKLNVSGKMLMWTFFLVSVCGTRAQSLSAPFSYILYGVEVRCYY